MTTHTPPPPTTGRYRRWRSAYDTSRGVQLLTGAVAVFVTLVLLALLLSWPRFFDMPSTFPGWVWFAIKLILILGLVWLVWRLLAHTRIGSAVVIVILMILLAPFVVGLIAGVSQGVRSDIGTLPPAPTTVVPPVTVTPTVTAPTVTVTPPTETVFPTGPQASDAPVPTPTVPTEQTVPPLVPVHITKPSSPADRVFALSGTGDIPEGQRLLVFVFASGTGLYYTDGEAVAQPGHQWMAKEVYLGSSSACDNGRSYRVIVVMTDDQTAAENSTFHMLNPDEGYAPSMWISKFGAPLDSVMVTRTGTPAC